MAQTFGTAQDRDAGSWCHPQALLCEQAGRSATKPEPKQLLKDEVPSKRYLGRDFAVPTTSTASSSDVCLGDLVLFFMVYIQTLLLEWHSIFFSLLSLTPVDVGSYVYESMWFLAKTLFILLKL